ncbi:hypothetical protein SZ25_00865 [Candidatus Arcanobacter lacustris]|uniref:Outer membrane protein beta-barrel domain-containing protein n=1 Tax=Candidatus Arcanibacter lacustris TaxID=1607817 RepID=A0A0F5MMM7_9RICK|nr:hypothetical protein SZ25_00865 [Candidatus Arcanobacter lacustris]
MKKIIFVLFFAFIANYAVANDKKSYVMMRLGTSTSSAKKVQGGDDFKSIKVNHSKGSILGGSVGYNATPEWRLAFSMNYMPKWRVTDQRTDTDNDTYFHQTYISSFAATIDSYYDINNFSFYNITPYIMGGVGLAINNIDDGELFENGNLVESFYRNSNTNIAWKIGAGVTYKVNDALFLETGYSYLNLGKIGSKIGKNPIPDKNYNTKLETNSGSFNQFKKLHSHQFSVGLGLRF